MNKILKIIIFISIIISSIFVIYKICFNKIFEIKLNWNINLPLSGKEIYNVDNSGVHGDGYRYTILHYNKGLETSDNKIMWLNNLKFKPDGIEFHANMNNIYTKLKITNEFKINLNDQLKYASIKDKKDNMSWIIFVFDMTENKLFIIEGIY